MINYREKLYKILMEDDVIDSIIQNIDYLIEIIPELKHTLNFEHNHPHHYLNVFEHTLYALSYSQKEFDVRLVLLLHDIGKPFSYQDEEVRHFRNHAKVSAEMSYNILKRLNFNDDEINKLFYLIKEHDTAITDEEIESNYELSLLKFKIQICDSLAHHPDKLEKRLIYLSEINSKLNIDREYVKKLNLK